MIFLKLSCVCLEFSIIVSSSSYVVLIVLNSSQVGLKFVEFVSS